MQKMLKKYINLIFHADEEVFEMNNGCICCTVRGDLIRILAYLVERKDRFDRVILETTGMADPDPVGQHLAEAYIRRSFDNCLIEKHDYA